MSMPIQQKSAMYRRNSEEQARNVLSMAASGGMPDTFWQSDRRIASACKVLGWTVEEGREWAQAGG